VRLSIGTWRSGFATATVEEFSVAERLIQFKGEWRERVARAVLTAALFPDLDRDHHSAWSVVHVRSLDASLCGVPRGALTLSDDDLDRL